MEKKYPVSQRCRWMKDLTRVICGKKDENIPSLVLRAMKQGERLWDIAKLYRTTVEAILAANELKEESAAVIGKLLLIPRRR